MFFIKLLQLCMGGFRDEVDILFLIIKKPAKKNIAGFKFIYLTEINQISSHQGQRLYEGCVLQVL